MASIKIYRDRSKRQTLTELKAELKRNSKREKILNENIKRLKKSK